MTHFWSSADVTQTVSLRSGGQRNLNDIQRLSQTIAPQPNLSGKDDRRDYRRIE